MTDPRSAVFERRLRPARRIVAVGGGKGGVGKTTVACLAALNSAAAGARVGLLDLDVHGGAAHLMMGIEPEFPAEENGIVPLIGPCGIHFMSATVFSGNRPLALRGAEVSDAISELLAVTVWPDLDILIVDLPPGLGEGLLDILRFVPRVEVVAVTTPQAAALAVTRRFLATVSRTATVAGVVANMTDSHGAEEGRPIADLAGQFSTAVLATLPADPGLEAAFGDPKRLSTLPVARAMNDSLTR